MKNDKIFILPIIVLAVLILGLGALYYYAAKGLPASDATTTTSFLQTVSPSTSENANVASPSVSGQTSPVTVVSNQGVLAQRLGWKTFTNTTESYALSYPPAWQLLSGTTLASMTDGTASVSVESFAVTPNTTPSMLATENGVYNTFETTVNAYDASESYQGASTVYFIVNGSVGYKITLPTDTNENDANVIRAMLLTFTVTAPR